MIKFVQRLSRWSTVLFLILIWGKAGASDCGAAEEIIFPSVFIYFGLFALSFFVWNATGGNK